MGISLPLVVLGFGNLSTDQRLLAVENESGDVMLPVFTDPILAERYRIKQNAELLASTLKFSASGRSDIIPEKLNTLMMRDVKQARDIIDAVMIVGKITMIAINPVVGMAHLCMGIDEFMAELG